MPPAPLLALDLKTPSPAQPAAAAGAGAAAVDALKTVPTRGTYLYMKHAEVHAGSEKPLTDTG